MSFLSRWFSKPADEDYEQILSNLALDIQKRQSRLADLRLRERRSTLLATTYALAGWVAYVSLWYLSLLPAIGGSRGRSAWERAAEGLPVVIGPILILFTRRIVQISYSRKGDAEENTLRNLLKQQRTKVEEIKKKTNYYSTRNLIERYDDSPGSPVRRRPVTAQQGQGAPQSGHSTPQRQPQPIMQAHTPTSALRSHLTTPAPTPLRPARKQWYDKLADALLGDDEEEGGAGRASSRYALICEKCFTHNGLVKESMWEDAQYVCPKCGHFNPSARSKKLSSGMLSLPNSPLSSFASLTHPTSPEPSLHTNHAEAIPLPSSPVKSESSRTLPRSGEGEGVSMMEVDPEE